MAWIVQSLNEEWATVANSPTARRALISVHDKTGVVDLAKGLVATDLVDIARGAVGGNIDTLVYDLTVDVLGRLDNETGDLTYVDDGYDLLSRIAVWVLQTGGRVIPVRSSDVISEIWNGTATARLRYPLSQ